MRLPIVVVAFLCLAPGFARLEQCTGGRLGVYAVGARGGSAGLTAWMRAQGDTVFCLDDQEPRLNQRPVGDERDTSTPRAMALFIDRFVHGAMLSDSSRALVLDWMRTNTTGDARLRAGAPSGWTVGDKTGSAPHRSNDIGFLTGPGGRMVIVAVYATETTAADSVVDGVIAQVAGAVTR